MPVTDVAVVGGGPAGLSAALFTEKNGLDTIVFDAGGSWVSKSHLYNYPGIGSMDGDVFLANARNQVELFGAEVREEQVTDVAAEEADFTVETEESSVSADYLILATGAKRDLAEALGCEFSGDVVDVDVSMETSVADAYATGAMVRAEEWQAVISAGDGAAAALNVLTKERGEHFHDFDTPGHAEDVAELLIEEGE